MILDADLLVCMIQMGFAAPGIWKTVENFNISVLLSWHFDYTFFILLLIYRNILIILVSCFHPTLHLLCYLYFMLFPCYIHLFIYLFFYLSASCNKLLLILFPICLACSVKWCLVLSFGVNITRLLFLWRQHRDRKLQLTGVLHMNHVNF